MKQIILAAVLVSALFTLGAIESRAAPCEPDTKTGVVCVGKDCATVGRTSLDGDSKNIIACLYTKDGSKLAWKAGALITEVLPVCNQPYEVLQSDGDNVTCACNDTSQIITSSCPYPWTGGTMTGYATYSCTTKLWSSVTPISNTCQCDYAPRTQHIGCPPGLQGTGIDQRSDFSCASNIWGAWYNTSYNCTTPPPSYVWAFTGEDGNCNGGCQSEGICQNSSGGNYPDKGQRSDVEGKPCAPAGDTCREWHAGTRNNAFKFRCQ